MSQDVIFAIVFGAVIISVTTVLPLSLIYMRRSGRTKAQQTLPMPDIVARLGRMEDGMEAMAAELERIGEGQRFTTRLLNERQPPALNKANTATRSD